MSKVLKVSGNDPKALLNAPLQGSEEIYIDLYETVEESQRDAAEGCGRHGGQIDPVRQCAGGQKVVLSEAVFIFGDRVDADGAENKGGRHREREDESGDAFHANTSF